MRSFCFRYLGISFIILISLMKVCATGCQQPSPRTLERQTWLLVMGRSNLRSHKAHFNWCFAHLHLHHKSFLRLTYQTQVLLDRPWPVRKRSFLFWSTTGGEILRAVNIWIHRMSLLLQHSEKISVSFLIDVCWRYYRWREYMLFQWVGNTALAFALWS